MLLLAVEVLAVQKKAKMELFELNDSEYFSNKKSLMVNSAKWAEKSGIN